MRTDVIIIGAGQAGLATSRCLHRRGIAHVVLERGQVAERWRSERWDSLSLLTPNWQTRLPGFQYSGRDPHGFRSSAALVALLEDYARCTDAPIETRTAVQRVSRRGGGYQVRTDRGDWYASHVVLATGHCDVPFSPPASRALDPALTQLSPSGYRNPEQLAPGGVLVVGASASGAQIAQELAGSGRRVVLSVGRHTRVPRRYRGADILWWLDRIGALDARVEDVFDVAHAREQPSLQLIGSDDARDLSLDTLQAAGVQLCGRLTGALNRRAYFADDLPIHVARAEAKLTRVLDRIDAHLDPSGLYRPTEPSDRPAPVQVPPTPSTLDLKAEGIGSVIWATGFRRNYAWLGVPVLDRRGEIIHREGITSAAGLYVMGLGMQRTRKSTFIDGVGDDAEFIVRHIAAQLGMRDSAAA